MFVVVVWQSDYSDYSGSSLSLLEIKIELDNNGFHFSAQESRATYVHGISESLHFPSFGDYRIRINYLCEIANDGVESGRRNITIIRKFIILIDFLFFKIFE